MIHLPTVKQLQYLTALYEHRHFGKAADACFVTQSTLSAGLRELESALDVVLVERTKRVVRFTPLGERIARKGYRVLPSRPFSCPGRCRVWVRTIPGCVSICARKCRARSWTG